VAEWLNASVLKTGVALQLPRVRIPPFPYFNKNKKPSLLGLFAKQAKRSNSSFSKKKKTRSAFSSLKKIKKQ
jgi:hypothetical protein